ncbi:MAG: 3',5'-cyclic-nucleotide phosphodiesterase [Gemmatimonadetes bacterium]|nr:3',5'-cyclic-nucleotide phosphodiesterase [Gemmatimonadota bacterium]
MLTILHLSDVHFGPPYVPAVGEALLRAAAELRPDLVVASGDFTQRAKPEQYAAARAFLDRLPAVPRVVTPGNHDVPLYRVFERVFQPYRNYRAYIAPELDYVLRLEQAVVVSLNSTAPLRAVVNGRIDPWQLEFCARAFADAPPGLPRILVTHHHFAPAPDYEGGQVMPHAQRALRRFQQLHVDLIMGGHLHRAYIGNSLDVYPGERQRRGIIIVQSGTSTSQRGRARERQQNSFNLVRIGADRVRVTHYLYFAELGGFAPVSRHCFPRPGHQWLADAHGEPGAGSAQAPPPDRAAKTGPGA